MKKSASYPAEEDGDGKTGLPLWKFVVPCVRHWLNFIILLEDVLHFKQQAFSFAEQIFVGLVSNIGFNIFKCNFRLVS